MQLCCEDLQSVDHCQSSDNFAVIATFCSHCETFSPQVLLGGASKATPTCDQPIGLLHIHQLQSQHTQNSILCVASPAVHEKTNDVRMYVG